MVESGQMCLERLSRGLLLAGFCVILGIVVPSPVGTAPPDSRDADLRGACYCRVMSELKCVSVITRAECDKQCAENMCDDWFWMERLTCWNWGYGG
jgi:hypothetical protein